MRWESLFADMESQLVAARAQELRDEVAELTRAERAQVALTDRLRAARGDGLRLLLRDGQTVDGTALEVAPQWLLLAPDAFRRALVPTAAIAGVVGLGPQAAPPAGTVERKLSLGHALRALARDRTVVRVDAQGAVVTGRVARVGADHVDVAPQDAAAGAQAWTLPFGTLLVVRSS
ncbi:hypothetical protein KIN34_10160 [Cellulomonas sp. DKR-3]|uniref:Fis family transcriptional regulator n=1 Tax=Cellulomonas fulva TaxID=2835530 RepID=A0ABS5TZU9_9CELL|nr:hypothetical protein [Cellulomonas fulva]MBT0994651.1 hypothetical protein [Cellulomonas fulva]